MGLFFIYSLKVALCLTAFYLVYKLLLSRETFFGFNRAVLLGMVGVSLILPLVRFTVDNVPEAVGGFIVVEDLVAQAVAADAPGFSVTAVQTCFIIYIIGVAFFFGREVWSLLCLRRLMRGGRVAGVSRGVRTIVVQGDVSRALFNHLEFRVDCHLWQRLSASLAMNWFHRFTYYDRWMDFPEENYSVYDYLVDSDQWDLRLMVRYGF